MNSSDNALRLISGYFADRTERYWLFTFVGYGFLLSIPLLVFADYWQLAVILIILERMGKAIRTPAREAILSHATKQVGRGWGFGIHETIMRAAIADLTSIEHRGFAYGIFNTIYGASWFLGSTLMGLLYDISIGYLILFVVVMEVLSIPAFFLVKKVHLPTTPPQQGI